MNIERELLIVELETLIDEADSTMRSFEEATASTNAERVKLQEALEATEKARNAARVLVDSLRKLDRLVNE